MVMVMVFHLGALLSLLWLLIGAAQVVRLRRSTQAAGSSLHELLLRVAEDPNRLPDLRLSASIAQPVALGLFRPTIIFPEAFVSGESESRLESALAHELAHIRNGDLWLLGTLRLLLPLLFGHPLYWWLRHCVRLDQELIADAAAARGDRFQYAQALLKWSQAAASRTSAFAGAVALWERPSLLARRIVVLLDRDSRVDVNCPMRWRWVIQGGTAAIVLALSILTLRPMALRAEQSQRAQQVETVGFRGRVLDPSGNPVGGASVRLMILADRHNMPELKALSAPDGRFEISLPEAVYKRLTERTYGETPRIVASAPGFGFGWAIPLGDKVVDVRLVKDDVPIEGRIVDPNGQPIRGATVKVHNLWAAADEDLGSFITEVKLWGRWPWQGQAKLSLVTLNLAATTAADGTFRLEGIGRNRVVELAIAGPTFASEEFYAITQDRPTLRSVSWVGVEGKLCTYHGARFTHTTSFTRPIVGTVRNRTSGLPIPGVRIRAMAVDDKDHHQQSVTTTSDAQGHFRLTGLPIARKYEVHAIPGPGIPFTPAKTAVAAVDSSTDSVTCEITIDRGVRVRGRLLEKATGRPIRGTVWYYPFPENPRFKEAETIHFEASTDDGGQFDIAVLPGHGLLLGHADDGEYLADVGHKSIVDLERITLLPRLAVRSPSIPTHHVVAELKLDPVTELFTQDLVLESARSATGRVVDPDGQRLGDVIGYGVDGHPWNHQILESGEFTLTNLDPRMPRRVTFFQIERKLAGSTRISGNETGPITVRLEPWGAVTGRVLDWQGHPETGLVLNGWPRNRSTDADEGTFPTLMKLDVQGRFRFEGLVPGLRYSAAVDGQGVMPDREAFRDVRVSPGETKDLGDLRLRIIRGINE
jgi:beta-lactamase regulating signal transducer with metallopeptidase domain